MEVARRPVHPGLRAFVESVGYYEVGGPDVRERMLPTGRMQLLVNLDADEIVEYEGAAVRRTGGAVLEGARSRYIDSDTSQQRSIAVVAFRPGGAFPFLPAPCSAAAGASVEADALWGRAGAVLRERLLEASPAARPDVLEAVLLECAEGGLEPDPAVDAGIAMLERGVPVGEVTARLGMTHRRFTRAFTDRTGFTPKRFARLRRFQRALAAVPYDRPVDWAELAAACGYYDQSHLIRDFREFAGMSPTEYRPRSPFARNHVPLPASRP